MIGTTIEGNSVAELLSAIEQAEAAGVPSVWHWTAGAAPDALTLFAAAAVRTQRIGLVASIVPTWLRHPIVVAQQAQVIDQLAPGRLRIGIGTSNRPGMERLIGADWRTPLTNIREYAIILKALLQQGSVDFTGEHFTARASIGAPVNVPVMAAALRTGAYRVCGEVTDGAISWLTPRSYVESTSLAALRAGAESAGRTPPPIAFHAPFCLTEDANAAREATRAQVGFYAGSPAYAAMYAEAGFPDLNGRYSDELIDAIVIYGDRDTVARRLAAQAGGPISDVVANPIFISGSAAEQQAAFEVVAVANAMTST